MNKKILTIIFSEKNKYFQKIGYLLHAYDNVDNWIRFRYSEHFFIYDEEFYKNGIPIMYILDKMKHS